MARYNSVPSGRPIWLQDWAIRALRTWRWPNKKRAKCKDCGANHGPGDGVFVPGWGTFCPDCTFDAVMRWKLQQVIRASNR